MSDPDRQTGSPASHPDSDRDESGPQGPSLALIYSLIAIALIAAIGFAMMIVMPFYHRR